MDSMPGRSQGAFWNAGSVAMITGLVRSSWAPAIAHLTEATPSCSNQLKFHILTSP